MSGIDWFADYEQVEPTPKPPKRVFVSKDIDDENYDENQDFEITSEQEANLVTSRSANLIDNKHYPVIDIDVPHKLVPSSTEGHGHLYIDVSCTWEDYVAFLEAGVKIGLIEQGYVDASKARGFTAVRKEGVYK